MKRKFLLIIGSVLLLVLVMTTMLFTCSASNLVRPAYDPNFNQGKGAFYANGVPITISLSAGKTIISWDGDSQEITDTTTVFGGGTAGTDYNSSNITMNSGTVNTIFGGGFSILEESPAEVQNAQITINGGNITNAVYGGGKFYTNTVNSNIDINGGNLAFVMGGGAASGTVDGIQYDTGTEERPQDSGTVVDNVIINIKNGNVDNLYGGGQGYSNTKENTINVNGGKIDHLIAGGSNGYTGKSNIYIKSGEILTYQSTNRGIVDDVNLKMTGGNVNDFYVAGEDEPDVTGVLNNADINLIGGNITNLNAGINDGLPFSITSDKYKVVYVPNIISNNNISDEEVTPIEYNVKIIEDKVDIFKGETKPINYIIETNPNGYSYLFEDMTPIWSTEYSNIATVDDMGDVTGVNVGSTFVAVNVGEKSDLVIVNVLDTMNIIIAYALLIAAILFLLIFALIYPI